MNYSKNVLFLYRKLVKIRAENLKHRRESRKHSWLIRKYKNLRKSRKEYSTALKDKEKARNRRLRKDLKKHNRLVRKYVKRIKLENKTQSSEQTSDLVELM